MSGKFKFKAKWKYAGLNFHVQVEFIVSLVRRHLKYVPSWIMVGHISEQESLKVNPFN